MSNNQSEIFNCNSVIIGDNLRALNILSDRREKFDIIYIDPPYNTGNDFSYNDKRPTETWLDFMEKRLRIAVSVLSDDGVIFISIDDNSIFELKLACDKIFNRQNFLGVFITKQAVRSNSKHINTIHEYVIAYAKNKNLLSSFQIKRINNPSDSQMIKDLSRKIKQEFKKFGKKSAEKLLSKLNSEYMEQKNITWLRNYSMVDDNGEIFFAKDLSVPGAPESLKIPEINLSLPALTTRKWSSSQKIIKLHNENRLHFKNKRPYEMHYLTDSCDNVTSILDFYSRQGTNDLNKLGLRDLFDTPKPVALIKYLIRISTYNKTDARILDFFAGSGTTGQAVMEINLEDNKNHHFTLIQLDEKIADKSAQYNFAIKNKILPTVDQLLIYRLKTAREKLHFSENFIIKKVGEL